MSDSFNIILLGQLDEVKTIAKINKQLQQIQNNINKDAINIRINIDDKKISVLDKFVQRMAILEKQGVSLNAIVKEEIRIYKDLDGLQKQEIKQTLADGQTIIKTRKNEITAQKELNKEIEKNIQLKTKSNIELTKSSKTYGTGDKIFDFTAKSKPLKEQVLYLNKANERMNYYLNTGYNIIRAEVDEYGKLILKMKNAEGIARNLQYQWQGNSFKNSGDYRIKDINSTKDIEKNLQYEQRVKRSLLGNEQNTNYSNLLGLIKEREKLETKLISLGKTDSITKQEIIHQIKQYGIEMNQILNSKIRINGLGESDAITNQRELELIRKIEQAENRIALAKKQQNDLDLRKTSTTSSGKRNLGEEVNFNKLINLNANHKELMSYAQAVGGLNAEVMKTTPKIDSFGNKMLELNVRAREGNKYWHNWTATLDESTGKLYKVDRGLSDLSNRQLGFIEQLKIIAQRIPLWMVGMTAFYGTLRQVQNGIQYITDIDTAITNLNKVTNESKETLKDFALEANNIGKNLARSTDEVINSTAEFARLGYKLQDAKILAQQAMLYSNVGNIDETIASQSLISAIKGFNIEVDKTGKNVQHIVDVYNEVGNNYAISSAGIGEAMSRSAASLYGAGNTIEQAVAMITAANAVVQNPDTVGTALKTVSMRLRGISDEGEEIQDLVPKVNGAFHDLGLEVLKDNNTFKSTYQIMDELAGKWEFLTDVQKANITEIVAGKRQGNIVVSMLNNWKDAEDSLITALMSANSAIKENEKYMQSIQAKTAQLKNTLIGSWQNALNSDTVINFIVSLTTLIRVFGNLPSIITLATTALLIWKGVAIQGAILSSLQFIGSLTTVATTVKTTTLATVGLTSAFNALKVAFATNPLGIAAVILTTLAGAFLLTKDSAEQVTQAISDQNVEQIKLADNNNKRVEALTVLQAKQKRLNEEIQSGTLNTEQLADKQAQLEDITKKVGLIITDEIKQRMILNGVEEDEIDEIIKLINKRNEELSSQYTNQLALSKNAINGAKDRIKAYQAEMDALKALQSSMGTKLRSDYGTTGDLQARKPSELKDAGFINATKFFISDLIPKSSDFNDAIDEYNTTSNKINELENKISADQSLIDSNQKILDNSLDVLSSIEGNLSGIPNVTDGDSKDSSSKEDTYITDQYSQALAALNAQYEILEYNKSKLSSTSQEYRDIILQEISIQKQQQDLAHNEADRLRAKLASEALDQKTIDETNKTIQELGNTWIDLQKNINDNNFEVATSNIKDFDKQASILKDDLSTFKSQLELLTPGTEEYNTKIKQVIETTKAYEQVLKNEQIYIEQQLKNDDLTIAKKQELSDTLRANTKEQIQLQLELQSQLASLADEVVQIYKDAYEAQKDAATQAIEDEMDVEEDRHKQVTDNLDDELKQYQDLIQAKLDALDKSESEYDYNTELTALQKERQEIQNKLNALSLDNSDYAKSQKEDLTKQLSEKDLAIQEKQHDRSIELQKDNLNTLLDSYQDESDAKKKTEDDNYEATKDSLDKQKKAVEKYWDNIINDDQKYSDIRRNIIAGNLEGIQSDFDSFSSILSSKSEIIGNNITNSLINKMKEIVPALQAAKAELDTVNTINNGSSNTTNTTPSNNDTTTPTPSNTQTSTTIDPYSINPETGISYQQEYLQNLVIAGNTSGASQEDIDNAWWAQNELDLGRYHDGGIVSEGSSSPSRITQLVNKLLNTKANEQVLIGLKNEVMSPQTNLSNFFIPNMQKLISSLTPQVSIAGGGDTNYNLTVQVSGFTGKKSDIDSLSTTIINSLKKMGK